MDNIFFNKELIIFENNLKKVVSNLENELLLIHSRTANIPLLSKILVNIDKSNKKQLNEISDISVLNDKTIIINPFNLKYLKHIENAISTSNFQFVLSIKDNKIKLTSPVLTTEVKKNLINIVKQKTEVNLVALRNLRHHFINNLKKEEKDNHNRKKYQIKIDELCEKYQKKIKLINDNKVNSLSRV